MAITDAASFFFAVDGDKSGDLTHEEIKGGLRELGANISMSQIEEFLEKLDDDKSGTIDAIEFVKAVDFVDEAEAEKLVSAYKPVTNKRLIELEDAEINGLDATLRRAKHKRRGLWEKGTSNQEEEASLLEMDKIIADAEERKLEIMRERTKREGQKDTAVRGRIRHSITAQSMNRMQDKEEAAAKKKKRRASVALVNALSPKIVPDPEEVAKKKAEEDKVLDNTDDGGRKSRRASRIAPKLKPVAYQAVSMAISAVLHHGGKKLNGHKLLDAESLFRALDEDFSGTVDRNELRTGLKRLRIGCTIAQLEAWIDALDVNGDGIIEEDEFVGFLEGQLDPEMAAQLGSAAKDLIKKKPKPRSPLMVDKLLRGDRLSISKDLSVHDQVNAFVTCMQKLERLYIHRMDYQAKIKTIGGQGGTKRGLGVDLLLDVETVKKTKALEVECAQLLREDRTGGELRRFHSLWLQGWQHNMAAGRSVPGSIKYEVEMKRREVMLEGDKPAWKAAISPRAGARKYFSRPGYLNESWSHTEEWKNEREDTHHRTGRYKTSKAHNLGLDVLAHQTDLARQAREAANGDASPTNLNLTTPRRQAQDQYYLDGLVSRRGTVGGAQYAGTLGHQASGIPDLDNSVAEKPAFLSARDRVRVAIDRFQKAERAKKTTSAW